MSDYFQTLERWQELRDTIKKLQGEERALREGLFSGTFPEPTEGTNTLKLPNGATVKGVYKFYRKPREDELGSLPKRLLNKVFRVKHELVTKEYRDLSEEDRLAVDSVLDIKPGLPSFDVVPPKPDAVSVAL